MIFLKSNRSILSLLLAFLLYLPVNATAITAFPGAVGRGANSLGGRGGTVYIVDQLGDDAAAEAAGVTLREAVEASGARYVVFSVSGVIDLDHILTIRNPNITIAGETSPGGVLIKSWQLEIEASNVIIRHVRFRNGCAECYAAGTCDNQGDSVTINNGSDIILDHCSISWGCDGTLDFGPWSDQTLDAVTISNCIIAEGINDAAPEADHSRGILLWGKYDSIDVSFYQNLIMHFYSRMPMANYSATFDLVNNVIYNWKSVKTPTLEPSDSSTINVNYLHNYLKPGPNSEEAYANGGLGYDMWIGMQIGSVTPYKMIYIDGNIGYNRDTDTGSDWIVSEGWSPPELLSTDFQASSAFTTTNGIAITPSTMTSTLADTIVAQAGATKPFRDSVDIRLVSEYTAGDKGTYPNMADITFPTFSNVAVPTDSDSDGMADSWEITTFGNLTKTATGDEDADGYDNIEEYFHYLAGESGSDYVSIPAPLNLRIESN